MTDWRFEVDLRQLNDWRRLAVSMTGGGDFASALFFVMPSSHFHGLDAGNVTVLIRDYPAWNRRVLATVVTFLWWN